MYVEAVEKENTYAKATFLMRILIGHVKHGIFETKFTYFDPTTSFTSVKFRLLLNQPGFPLAMMA